MNTKNNQNNPSKGLEKRRSTFAILFYINRTKIRKDGMCQLLCKVSIDAEAEQIGTKVSVDPKIWNPQEGKAAGKSRNALEINAAIEKLTKTITGHYHQIRGNLGFVTAELVKNALKGIAQKPLTLMKLFEEHNAEFLQRVGVDRKKEMYEVYRLSAKHLQAFLRAKYEVDDVSLRSLTSDFYDAFDLFLRKDKGLMPKTAHQHLYNLKKITRRAVGQGTLRRDPFHTLRPPLPPLRSRHLTMEELERVMAYVPKRENLRRVRDWFIFSTFTGLAYCDLRRLSEDDIITAPDGGLYIYFDRKKTGTDFRVRLMEIPLQIIEKYQAERTGKRIFNTYDRRYMYALVKELGKLCGITGLHYHQSRHNFGTHITLSQGVPIETVSRMMGHKSITTTQIYAKVTDKKVDEDMKRLKARTADKTVPLYEDERLRAAIRFPGVKRAGDTSRTANGQQKII
jgi:site-specific recombinase XerD